MHSFSEYFLRACHVQRAGLGPGDRAESRTGGTAASGARALAGATDTRQLTVPERRDVNKMNQYQHLDNFQDV